MKYALLLFAMLGVSGAQNLASVSPTCNAAGSKEMTLTLHGTGFKSTAQVTWAINGKTTILKPSYVSSIKIRVVIPAALMAAKGSADVGVKQ